jgi:hypothetical protein
MLISGLIGLAILFVGRQSSRMKLHWQTLAAARSANGSG